MPQPILLSPLLAAVFFSNYWLLLWTSGQELKLFISLKSELFRCEQLRFGQVVDACHGGRPAPLQYADLGRKTSAPGRWIASGVDVGSQMIPRYGGFAS